LGGIFLLYLAFSVYKSWRKFSPEEKIDKTTGAKTLFNAVIVNLLNPNPYIGWSLIMGPIFLEAWYIMPIYGISLIASFYFMLILLLMITIILFAFAGKLGPKVNKVLLGLSSFALLCFGIYQLIVGINYYS
jgi:threonine/homoserine/homoserine lactone efflux protein